MKPKIVILTSRFPFPLEKGDKLRAYYFIKELSNLYRVVLISLSDKKVNDNEFKELESKESQLMFDVPEVENDGDIDDEFKEISDNEMNMENGFGFDLKLDEDESEVF